MQTRLKASSVSSGMLVKLARNPGYAIELLLSKTVDKFDHDVLSNLAELADPDDLIMVTITIEAIDV